MRYNVALIDSDTFKEYHKLGGLKHILYPNHIILMRVQATEVRLILDVC